MFPESVLFEKEADVRQVAVFEHGEDWSWRRRDADHFNLWLALEGAGELSVAGRVWPFAAGSLFLLPPGDIAAGRGGAGQRVTNFTMHICAVGGVARWLGELGAEGRPVALRQLPWTTGLVRHLSEAFYFDRERSQGVVLAGLQLLLRELEIGRSGGWKSRADTDLTGIVERIRRNPASAYSVGELAASMGLSNSQFTRRFKTITGVSPNRFIVEERLARAEAYLRETRLSVQAISARLGYRDVYFFSRQFRRFRGVTPTQARARREDVDAPPSE